MSTPRSPRPIATESTVRTRAKRPRASRGERESVGSDGASASGRCMLGRLQHFHHTERPGATGERLRAREDAVHEVLGGERQRLLSGRDLERTGGEMGDRDDRRGVATAVRTPGLDRVVVERDAALLEAALVAEHALATDDDDLGGLLRM